MRILPSHFNVSARRLSSPLFRFFKRGFGLLLVLRVGKQASPDANRGCL